VSFLSEIDGALADQGVRPRARRQIVDEFRDHIACEPEAVARLGDPTTLAQTFAAELAGDEARRCTRNTFGALSLAAVALVAGQLLIHAAGGYPDYNKGTSTPLALAAIAMITIAPQVAFAAGSLAALRAWRRRRARQLPDAEVALIHRRGAVGRTAGIVTCLGMLVYVANDTQRLAGWWLIAQAAMAMVALGALVAARTESRACATTVGAVSGPAGGLAVDLPPLAWLAARPWTAWAIITTAAFLATAAFTGHAEGSLVEGLERGGLESIALGAGLASAIALTHRHRS
jgi:hypothetical protein